MKWFLGLVTLVTVFSGCSFVEKKETQAKIKSTVYQNNNKLSYCYKKALEDQNNLEGEMSMEWDVVYIDGQEKVANVAIKDTNISSEVLANCLKAAVSQMHFNLPTRNQQKVHRVSYPFVFKNDGSTEPLRR